MPIAITRVVKDTFWQCIKYKILLKIVLQYFCQILLTSLRKYKIQNTYDILPT